MSGVQTALDSGISKLICTNLDYAQYPCAPKERCEHGVRHITDCRARRSHPDRRCMGTSPELNGNHPATCSTRVVGHEAADVAAQALGLSRSQVYALIRCARQGTGLATDLACSRSCGVKGKGRLRESVEWIILAKQKHSLAALYREVAQAYKKTQKLWRPVRNSVALADRRPRPTQGYPVSRTTAVSWSGSSTLPCR